MSHFIPEPSNYEEVTRLPSEVKEAWLKKTLREIKILVENQTFLMEGPRKEEPLTPCMGMYKEKIQSGESINKLKLRIVVRGEFPNKKIIGDT